MPQTGRDEAFLPSKKRALMPLNPDADAGPLGSLE